jgi:hypothetical protein
MAVATFASSFGALHMALSEEPSDHHTVSLALLPGVSIRNLQLSHPGLSVVKCNSKQQHIMCCTTNNCKLVDTAHGLYTGVWPLYLTHFL